MWTATEQKGHGLVESVFSLYCLSRLFFLMFSGSGVPLEYRARQSQAGPRSHPQHLLQSQETIIVSMKTIYETPMHQ